MEISSEDKEKLFRQFRHSLGAPIRQIELTDEQLCTLLEISIEDYAQYVQEWLIEHQWQSLLGQNITTTDMAFALSVRSLDYVTQSTYAYSKQVGLQANGPWELKKDYVELEAGRQVYQIPAGREINEVLWITPPATSMALLANYGGIDYGFGGGFAQTGLGGTGGMVAAAALAPETFGASLLLPLIGSAVGKYFGDKAFQDDTSTEPKQDVKQYNDAIAFNPNDKFTKVNDGTMIAGTNANGNASLARSISSMMAPGQNSSTGAISPATTNVNLSDLKVSGSIELKINQSMSRELGENLLHDANFIRNISRLINMSISQNTNMVQKA